MIFIDKMQNLKIYKTKTFLPTTKGDKKRGHIVLMLTPNFNSSKNLMNNDMFVNSNRYQSYYLEKDVSYYINSKVVEEVEESTILNEWTELEDLCLETKRSELPDSEFGVPEQRKFPLDTEAHVRSAIKFFNYVEPKYEAELARRIIAKMKKFGIDDVNVSEQNRFSKYYHPKNSVKEDAILEDHKYVRSMRKNGGLYGSRKIYDWKSYDDYRNDNGNAWCPTCKSVMHYRLADPKTREIFWCPECKIRFDNVHEEGYRCPSCKKSKIVPAKISGWEKIVCDGCHTSKSVIPGRFKTSGPDYKEISYAKPPAKNVKESAEWIEDEILTVEEQKDVEVKKCKFCGSEDILVKIDGEPVYICKDCGKYLGTVPFKEEYTDDSLMNTDYFLKVIPESDVIDLGDKIVFLNESEINDKRLKQMLFKARIRKRKDVLNILDQVKSEIPWIKYAFPEIRKYNRRNLFMDLSYYTTIFFENNTWRMKKGFGLYLDFMSRLINHPVTKSEGYSGRTIFVPVEDWNKTHDNMIWNYKINLNPMSCIYQLLFEGKLPELKKAFGNTDVVFFGKTCYFKINFAELDPKEIKRYAAKFRVFCVKICNSEEFEPEDIDTTADNAESPEVLQAKIADKIEIKTGVDITKAIAKSVEKKNILSANVPDVPDELRTNAEKDKLVDKHKTIDKIYHKVKGSNISDMTFQKNSKISDPAADRIITRLKELDKDLDDEVDVDYDTQDDAEKEADIDKLADALVNATQDSTDEEEALDKMDHDDYDDEIKRIYLTLGNDDEVKISDTRAARMTEMDKQVLDKEINGRSIKDILSEENKSTKQETTTIKVASPNQDEWTDLGYMNLDKQYDIDRDIVAIFKSFANTSRPMVIRDIQVTNNSTSEDRIVLYDVQMEDYKGRRYRIKLDIPIMEDNRFLLRGYSKSINCQFLNAPILKVALDSCHILSNYSKIIMERMNDTSGRSLPATAKFMKTIGKYAGRTLKFTPGNNFKVCAKYHLPIDYIDLANSLSKIESPKWIIYFNQDEIREQYTVDETKGIPVLYNKELKAIEYYNPNDPSRDTFIGYLLAVVENTDPAFGDLYATITRSSSSAYTRCHIMSQYIPTALVCAYHVGLTEMLKRAGIEYRTVEKLDSEIKHDASYDWIEFDDGYLVYKVTYNSSLLMNGLKIKTCGTEAYKLADMDNRNMYLDFLDSFGGRIIADGLDNFKDLFVDPMTIETLKYYHLPTDYIDILLYGSNMLADNKFVKHTDARSKKLRRYQLVSVYTYNVLAKAYGRYITGDKHSNNPQFTVKQTDVIDKFLTDNITSDDSCINALREVETTNAVTTKGPSGMNSDRAYSLDKRGYDESMVNVLGMSTGFAGNAGITRQTTINADITPDGFVRDTTGKDMNDANTLTATESLIPFGSTRDDPMRTAMSFVQTSKHMVRTEESDPLLVTSGADEVMPYLTTDKFAYKAKGDGKVIELNENYCIIEYTDGKKDYINFDEKIEKNSDGGYYVPLKLDPAEGLKLNSRVKKNQIVAYDKYSFSSNLGESNNLAYNIGKLAKIAILNTDEGFEDAGIISASMAKKLATRVNIKYDCVINKDSRLFQIVKVGDHVEASDDLVIWEDAVDDSDSEEVMKALSGKDFSDLGKRKLKSDVTGVVTAIKIYRTVELDDLSPSLHKLVSAYEKPLVERAKVLEENNIPYAKTKVDAYYKLNPTGKLKKSQEAIFVEIFVEYLDTVGVGDKIVYNSANKAVEKGIFPEGKEPYTAFRPNEKIDAFVADTSISKRIVTSTYVYGAIQKALIELDRSVKDIMGIPYDDSTV